MPIAGRLPFEWIYPTGEKQEKRIPKWEKYYQWGTVIAGDCHYIKRHMPDKLEGKIIATNTTTAADIEHVPHRRGKIPGHLNTGAGRALLWNQYDGGCAGCYLGKERVCLPGMS